MTTLRGSLENAKTNPAPAIDCYAAPPHAASRIGIIIFPGGGYEGLADYEGEGYARWFARRGISCFVVGYRLGSQGYRHPAMLEDALAAVRTVRAHARDLGIDPARIGVMGSSAGGHLAALAMVSHDRYQGPVSLRPDFGILCYPVISMGDALGHVGSRDNLLGPSPSRALKEDVSCELHVTPRTPPCFLWHTRDDGVVSFRNSTTFADALHAAGVAFELHVFDSGPHGLGKNLDHPWALTCLRWVQSLGQPASAGRPGPDPLAAPP